MQKGKIEVNRFSSLGETAGRLLADALCSIEDQVGEKMEEVGSVSVIFSWNGKDYQAAVSPYAEKEEALHTAHKKDHVNHPMPRARVDLGLHRHFDHSEYGMLKRGFVPGSMDDRWFICFDPKRLMLRIHRSWTGFCVFSFKFAEDSDGCHIIKSRVNRNPEQYESADIAYDAEVATWAVDALVLKKDCPFPTKKILTPARVDLSTFVVTEVVIRDLKHGRTGRVGRDTNDTT